MAQSKQFLVTSVGEWQGPFQRGKFTDYEAVGTIKTEKGEMECILQVGGKYQCEHLTPDREYTGKFVGKDDESGMWKVAFTGTDNPQSLKKPGDTTPFTGAARAAGGGRNEDLIVAQVAFKGAVELACAKQIKVADIGSASAKFFQIIKDVSANKIAVETKDEEPDDELPF